MHTSKLSTFVIDCQTSDLNAAAEFWSKALRRGIKTPQPGDDRYRDLACTPSEPLVMIQQVEHEGRIHLDIESDDIEAEVARLTQLGAKPLQRIRTWVVMLAPTGQRFCVVKQQRPGSSPAFAKATPWHQRLQSLVGSYSGTTRTWLDPEAAPEVATGELYVSAILGGRWLRLEQLGSVAGTAHAGELLLGYHIDGAEFELCWVDSFHTGSAMMRSSGKPQQDGVISVTGSYAAGSERWGWRTELHLPRQQPGPLTLRAFNISPAGQEWPAIESIWTRL